MTRETDINPHGLPTQQALLYAGYSRGYESKFHGLCVDDAGHVLECDAATAFMSMARAAELDGIKLKINSAFRSHDEQKVLYERYQRRLTEWQDTPVSERGPKPAIAAPPGYSNHQSGIAVDIDTGGPSYGPIDKWLEANAGQFGFTRTVSSEPWHFEFITNGLYAVG